MKSRKIEIEPVYLVVEIKGRIVFHFVDGNREYALDVVLLLLSLHFGHFEHTYVVHAELEHGLGDVIVRMVEEPQSER